MTMTTIHYDTLLDTIGNTPLVRLQNINPYPLATILVKLEFLNPGSSIKDRIVRHIIDDAEKQGLLKPGGTIIEATSGNTGAAVAMIAALRGYKAILTMPDKVSKEKQNVCSLRFTRTLCQRRKPLGRRNT
jgi:cystathionine beta-synthase/cysteine synthase A